MFLKYHKIFKCVIPLLALSLSSSLISGCIIQVPANQKPNQQANNVVTPDIMEAYHEIPQARSKGERSIADDGVPLPQQIAQIEAFLSNPSAFRAPEGEDSELSRQIETQMKLKQLQNDLDDMDDLSDFDI
ncbi:hypothetical protein [Thorsellia kenyensis]|uniref:Lipoprotein n=1 Tax=Thorsellia kenyensis TaxID=1549888 RepID=A0ABV6C8T6_9GAMM